MSRCQGSSSWKVFSACSLIAPSRAFPSGLRLSTGKLTLYTLKTWLALKEFRAKSPTQRKVAVFGSREVPRTPLLHRQLEEMKLLFLMLLWHCYRERFPLGPLLPMFHLPLQSSGFSQQEKQLKQETGLSASG